MFSNLNLLYEGCLPCSQFSCESQGPGIAEDKSNHWRLKQWRHCVHQLFPYILPPSPLCRSGCTFSLFLIIFVFCSLSTNDSYPFLNADTKASIYLEQLQTMKLDSLYLDLVCNQSQSLRIRLILSWILQNHTFILFNLARSWNDRVYSRKQTLTNCC